jgi:hypothetical protein
MGNAGKLWRNVSNADSLRRHVADWLAQGGGWDSLLKEVFPIWQFMGWKLR